VLEGFLSVLLKEEIKIIHIKESESNQEHSNDKFNRVDILVQNQYGELLIIEMQNSEEVDYFLRMLYGVSKSIAEHIAKGEPYTKVRKVYHINIVYFRLGQGTDYVYCGSTEFRGIHSNELLQLTHEQKAFFAGENRHNVNEVKDLYPEYYILCVENFDNIAKSSLDEWMYYLKNNVIPDEFTAPGLEEVRERLQYDALSEEEKMDYDHHLKQRLYEQNTINTAVFKGEVKGHAEGRAEGEVIGLAKGQSERTRLKTALEAAQAEKEATQAEMKAKEAGFLARIAELERLLPANPN
jgi:predicted transposase/invertase (TIGR01784 family)